MRVRYTENATAELAKIFEYIARNNPAAAKAVVGRVEALVARLAVFPGTGHPCDTADVLVAPLVRFPYSIYYKVEGETLLILHVHHGARRPPQFHEMELPFRR